MQENSSENLVREQLVQIATTRESILASELGSLIHLTAKPEIASAGGLLKFLRRHQDLFEVEYSDNPGTLRVKSKVYASGGDSTSVSPWIAFVHTDSPYHLYFDRSDVALRVSTIAKESWSLIEKLSEEELREIASDFLEQVESPLAEELTAALSQPKYWRPWSQAIQKDSSISRAFAVYRKEHIILSFKNRLRKLAIPEAHWPLLEGQLTARPLLRQIKTAYPENSEKGTMRPDLDRQLLTIALTCMSDAELAQVWLPAGALLESFRRYRSQL